MDSKNIFDCSPKKRDCSPFLLLPGQFAQHRSLQQQLFKVSAHASPVARAARKRKRSPPPSVLHLHLCPFFRHHRSARDRTNGIQRFARREQWRVCSAKYDPVVDMCCQMWPSASISVCRSRAAAIPPASFPAIILFRTETSQWPPTRKTRTDDNIKTSLQQFGLYVYRPFLSALFKVSAHASPVARAARKRKHSPLPSFPRAFPHPILFPRLCQAPPPTPPFRSGFASSVFRDLPEENNCVSVQQNATPL